MTPQRASRAVMMKSSHDSHGVSRARGLNPMAHVLIVDDDSYVRAVLSRLISRHGHTVSEAADGVEGAAAVRRLAPDLVVTDMEMPGGSGFNVLEAGTTAKIPVVIL